MNWTEQHQAALHDKRATLRSYWRQRVCESKTHTEALNLIADWIAACERVSRALDYLETRIERTR